MTGAAGGHRRGDEMAAIEVEVGKAVAHAGEPRGVRAQPRRQVSGEPVIGSGEIAATPTCGPARRRAGSAGDNLRLLECAQSRPARQVHQAVVVAVGTGLTAGVGAQDAKGCWGRCAERRREGPGGAACHARLEASALSDLAPCRTRAQPCLSKWRPTRGHVATTSRLDQGVVPTRGVWGGAAAQRSVV